MEWSPDVPIRTYVESVREEMRTYADYLFSKMHSECLHVALFEAPDMHHHSHKVRVAETENPLFYRTLWNDHSFPKRKRPSRNKPRKTSMNYKKKTQRPSQKLDSDVRRGKFIKALERISHLTDKPIHNIEDCPPTGVRMHTLYARAMIFEHLTEGYIDPIDGPIPISPVVCKYFGVDTPSSEFSMQVWQQQKEPEVFVPF